MTNFQRIIYPKTHVIRNKSDLKYEVRSVGCQKDFKSERHRRRNKREEIYREMTNHGDTYKGSKSSDDIGVGRVRAMHKKKVKKIYLPETVEKAEVSSKLSCIFGKSRQRLHRRDNDTKKTSTKCVGGNITNNKALLNKKISAIIHNDHKEIGSDIAIKKIVDTVTQVEDSIDKIIVFNTIINPKVQRLVVVDKDAVKSKSSKKGDSKRIIRRKTSLSTLTDLGQYEHNVETSSGKQSDLTSKLERDYWSLFLCKSKDKKCKKITKEKCAKSATLLKRRFDALRRGWMKIYNSTRNVTNYKKSSLKNEVFRKGMLVSNSSSLESHSFSNIKTYSSYVSKTDQKNYEDRFNKKKNQAFNLVKDKQFVQEEYNGWFYKKKGQAFNRIILEENNDSLTHGKGFRRWGKKHNVECCSPITEYYKTLIYPKTKTTAVKEIPSKPKEKKEPRKFFFFKKKVKNKDNRPSKTKNDVTDDIAWKKRTTNTERTNCDERKSDWLNKIISNKTEHNASVKVRWNNRKYASSSTVFELIDNVYKGTDSLFKCKSEIPGYTDCYRCDKTLPNFIHGNIETWMVRTLINDRLQHIHGKPEDLSDVDNLKHFIDKFKSFSEKLEMILRGTNLKIVPIIDSSGYLPEECFGKPRSDTSNPLSDEKVFKIVEYDTGSFLKTKTVKVTHKNNVDNIKDTIDDKVKIEEICKYGNAQGSTIVPKNCDFSVGINPPRKLREFNNKANINNDISKSDSNLAQYGFTESYIQDYYWSLLGINLLSWCISDCHLEWCSDSLDSTYNRNRTRSRTNFYDDFFTSSSTPPKLCLSEICGSTPCEEKKGKISFCRERKKEEGHMRKNILPRDSIELYQNRKWRARLKCMRNDSGPTRCSISHLNQKTSITNLGIQDSASCVCKILPEKRQCKQCVALADDTELKDESQDCSNNQVLQQPIETKQCEIKPTKLKIQPIEEIKPMQCNIHPIKCKIDTKADGRTPISDKTKYSKRQQRECDNLSPRWVVPKSQFTCSNTKHLCGLKVKKSCSTQDIRANPKQCFKTQVKASTIICQETKRDNKKLNLEECPKCKSTCIHNMSCETSFQKNHPRESIFTNDSSYPDLQLQTRSSTVLSPEVCIQDLVFQSSSSANHKPMISDLDNGIEAFLQEIPLQNISSTSSPEAESYVCSNRHGSYHEQAISIPPNAHTLTPLISTHRCVTMCKHEGKTRCCRLPLNPRVSCHPAPSFIPVPISRHPRISKSKESNPKDVKVTIKNLKKPLPENPASKIQRSLSPLEKISDRPNSPPRKNSVSSLRDQQPPPKPNTQQPCSKRNLIPSCRAPYSIVWLKAPRISPTSSSNYLYLKRCLKPCLQRMPIGCPSSLNCLCDSPCRQFCRSKRPLPCPCHISPSQCQIPHQIPRTSCSCCRRKATADEYEVSKESNPDKSYRTSKCHKETLDPDKCCRCLKLPAESRGSEKLSGYSKSFKESLNPEKSNESFKYHRESFKPDKFYENSKPPRQSLKPDKSDISFKFPRKFIKPEKIYENLKPTKESLKPDKYQEDSKSLRESLNPSESLKSNRSSKYRDTSRSYTSEKKAQRHANHLQKSRFDSNCSCNVSREIVNISLVNESLNVKVNDDQNVKVENEKGVTFYESKGANCKRLIQDYKTDGLISRNTQEESVIDAAKPTTIDIQVRVKVTKDKDNNRRKETLERSEKQIKSRSLDIEESVRSNVLSKQSDINIRILIKKIKHKEKLSTNKEKQGTVNEYVNEKYLKDAENAYYETNSLKIPLPVKPSTDTGDTLTDYDIEYLVSSDLTLSQISTGHQDNDRRSLTSTITEDNDKDHKHIQVNIINTVHVRNESDVLSCKNDIKEAILKLTNDDKVTFKRLLESANKTSKNIIHVEKIEDTLKVIVSSNIGEPIRKKPEEITNKESSGYNTSKCLVQCNMDTLYHPIKEPGESNSLSNSTNEACNLTDRLQVSSVKCCRKNAVEINSVDFNLRTDSECRKSETDLDSRNTDFSKNIRIMSNILGREFEVREISPDIDVDEEKIVVLSTDDTVIPKEHLLHKPPNPIANIRASEILQSYETKKAVFEIYAKKIVSDKGECLIAKLPKFGNIQTNYKEMVSNNKTVCKRNIVMLSFK